MPTDYFAHLPLELIYSSPRLVVNISLYLLLVVSFIPICELEILVWLKFRLPTIDVPAESYCYLFRPLELLQAGEYCRRSCETTRMGIEPACRQWARGANLTTLFKKTHKGDLKNEKTNRKQLNWIGKDVFL